MIYNLEYSIFLEPMRTLIFAFFLSLIYPLNSAAITYYAISSGSWNSTNVWSTMGCTGLSCTCTPVAGSGNNIIICTGVTVTNNGALTIGPGSFSGLTIYGTLDMWPSGSITIKNGGLLNIEGTLKVNVFTNENNSDGVLINGTLGINTGGTIDNNNGADIIGYGSIIISSPVSFSNNGTIFGNTPVPCNNCTISGSILPIELISFKGETYEKYNLIKWATASEINNSYFTIERSFNSLNFTIVGEIKGSGNSFQLQFYEIKDFEYEDITYYRLKQTDYDGKDKTFGIISVIHSRFDYDIKILKITNIMGQKVDLDYEGVQFIYFSNGSILKNCVIK